MGKTIIMAAVLAAVAGCTTGDVTSWRGVDYKKLPPGLCTADGSPVVWQKANAAGNFPEPKNLSKDNCR